MALQMLSLDSFVNFNKALSEKFSIPLEKLSALWALPPAPKPVKAKAGKADPNGPKCVHIYQKGKRPGQACGDPVCADSTSYCRKHMKYEGTKPASASAPGSVKTGITRPPAVQLHISKNDYGNYEHKETGLLFNKEKKVYGRQVGDQVMKLSASDIKNCELHNFSYLSDAVESAESTDPTPDEEALEEEPEESEEEVEEVEDDA